jgi:hypothetical protein
MVLSAMHHSSRYWKFRSRYLAGKGEKNKIDKELCNT